MSPRSIHAIRLEYAALILLALLPFAMAVANRSAAAVITLAGIFALLARIVDGVHMRNLFTISPATLAALAFIAWAVLSLGWSHVPATSLFVMSEAGLPFIGGVLLLACLPRTIPKGIVLTAAIAFAISCIMIIVELQTGMETRRMVGARDETLIFNRSVMTLLLIFWPLAIHMDRLGWRRWAFVFAVLLIVTVITATSGASMLGLMLSLPAFLIALKYQRAGFVLASAMLAGCLLLAPFKGALLERILPQSIVMRLESVHAADRIEIWQDFAAVVRERPLRGAGFGVSAKMADAPFVSDLPSDRRQLLAVGHPHDGFLQIWAELGLIGAVLAGINGIFLLRAIAHLPKVMAAAAVASTIAAAAVVCVFHGAWQGWWIGLLMATGVWCSRDVKRPLPQHD
ncbi:O-antigen ligase family protein [Pseudochelatococcus sp. G4_1912]|uniref:O-antigen ligase family protein n=1 Tax=Pseudochelatococcus sp. G4_1912 TaxID=3114288 RepID=UPI0039C65529